MGFLKGLGKVGLGGIKAMGGIMDATAKVTGLPSIGTDMSKFAEDLSNASDSKTIAQAIIDKASRGYKNISVSEESVIDKVAREAAEKAVAELYAKKK